MSQRLSILPALLALTLLSTGPSSAQPREPADTELWTDLGVRLKMTRDLSTTFTYNLRFDDGGSRRYLSAPELSIRYRLTKWWQLGGGYRYLRELDHDSVFQDRYRIHAETRLLAKYRPVTIGLRIRWQEEVRDEDDDGTPTRHYLRTRLKTKLRRVPFVSPYALAEMFLRLDGADKDLPAGTVKKWRLGLGVEWQSGPFELDARYYLSRPVYYQTAPLENILSVGVSYDLAL